jgi:hypothetical protein
MYRTVVTICTNRFDILPTRCIYVFCMDIRTNSDLCHLQHKLIGFYNWDEKCLQRGTDWVFIYNSGLNENLRSAHTVFMCFVWIWEQTAIISLYNINWLVFITEMKSVYSAVRTGYLYIIPRSTHTVYLCVLCGSQNKQRLFPYTTWTDWFL